MGKMETDMRVGKKIIAKEVRKTEKDSVEVKNRSEFEERY